MSYFLRLHAETDKARALSILCHKLRNKQNDDKIFEVSPSSFDTVPGKPFSYWVNDSIRQLFISTPPFTDSEESRVATKGLATTDDFRFLRTWWEHKNFKKWYPIAKGGVYSPYFADINLCVNWGDNGEELKSYLDNKIGEPGQWSRWINATPYYFRPGLTWPNSSTLGLTVRILPRGCIFSHMGCSVFFKQDSLSDALVTLGIMNSKPFKILVSLLLGLEETRKHYEVGVIQRVPVPHVDVESSLKLSDLVRKAWSLKRRIESFNEISHAFLLPAALRRSITDYYTDSMESDLFKIQDNIDQIVFTLYGFSESDVSGNSNAQAEKSDISFTALGDLDEEENDDEVDFTVGLLSWAVGVAFGRFSYELSKNDFLISNELNPFDPLPTKSPGMLRDGVEPFHIHAGILVDDQGHQHDIARLVEEVMIQFEISVPSDLRRWLQKDFFAFHLQRYSKSRRRAPIYWPLATASGSYTLWVYYPSLNNQTLFTAVNDFLDGPNGKLTQVSRECAELRVKGNSRSRDEEKQYDTLQTLEQELIELRDTLLKIAPGYQPNHDDGVQITAAPLWPLFRHKPWQKVLKDTWTKMEKGDYDWAHLAMAYWPERVREKCKTDKSLAIAHGLEDLYVEPEATTKKTRGKKKTGANE